MLLSCIEHYISPARTVSAKKEAEKRLPYFVSRRSVRLVKPTTILDQQRCPAPHPKEKPIVPAPTFADREAPSTTSFQHTIDRCTELMLPDRAGVACRRTTARQVSELRRHRAPWQHPHTRNYHLLCWCHRDPGAMGNVHGGLVMQSPGGDW